MATPSQNLHDNQVDLLLVGKTGHGKSSTANAILGREAFVESDNSEAETFVVQVGWARRLDRIIKVIDTPGLFENRMKKGEARKKAIQDMEQSILQCPKGFHALILVFKYGNRFTKEELDTVKLLKAIFGDTFVRDHCIVIFTHGDLFDAAQSKKKISFSQWCKEQKGECQDLLQECDYKALLFCNNSQEKSESQLKELLALVDDMSKGGHRYTNEIFKKAERERERIIVKENAPQLREEIQSKVSLLVDGLEALKLCENLDDDAVQSRVESMIQDCKDLLTEIREKDKETGVLDSLRKHTETLLKDIEGMKVEWIEKKEDSEDTLGSLLAQMELAKHIEMVRRHLLLEHFRQAMAANEPTVKGIDPTIFLLRHVMGNSDGLLKRFMEIELSGSDSDSDSD